MSDVRSRAPQPDATRGASVEALVAQGRLAEAISFLDQALATQPTAELWSDWATLHYAYGDSALAAEGYRKALGLDPLHRDACVNFGLFLIARGKLDEGWALLAPHAATLTSAERAKAEALTVPFAEAGLATMPSLVRPAQYSSKRRFLVVVRAGDTSLHPTWLAGQAEREWDLLVHAFGAECPWVDQDGLEVVRAVGDEVPGPKLRAIHSLYQRRRQDFLAYDYVCFPDDDLACDLETLNRLFLLCEQFGLDYAQPALTHDSHMANWGITMENRSFLLRYTSFVEVMAPVFSRSYLERCAPTFNENISGFGLDFLWSRWIASPWKMGILDACAVKHTRAPRKGPLYEMLARMGTNPDAELIALINKWQLVDEKDQVPGQVVVPTPRVLGGILTDGTRVTLAEGQGMRLLQALINGFPEEISRDHRQAVGFLLPVIQHMLSC